MGSYAYWQEANQMTRHLTLYTKTTTMGETMEAIC